jgi:hypothetical protein
MAGAKAPSFVDGRSLLPLLHGSATKDWRQSYLVEHWKTTGADAGGSAPLEPTDPDQGGSATAASDQELPKQTTTSIRLGKAAATIIPEYHAVRTSRYLYVEYATGERELYDTSTDPDELHNLVSTADPALLRTLAARVKALSTCKAAACRRIEAQPVPS